jgi:selenocysteine lyase/cysteine desulfurase
LKTAIPETVTVYGLPAIAGRVPTFLVNVSGVSAVEVVEHLAALSIGVWAHNSWYALALYERLDYDSDAIRIGCIHYNTAAEVDRLVAGLTSARPATS